MAATYALWFIRALAACGSFAWLLYCLRVFPRWRKLPLLSEVPPEAPPAGLPSVAMIIPARDEALTIEQALRSVLALDYPNLSIIVVNDRSTDATAEILARLAEQDPRLRVVTIDNLPSGWLGKTWAMQSGLEASKSDWVLFTDADVVYEPTTLRRLFHALSGQAVDHVVLVPDVVLKSFGERSFYTMFLILFWAYCPPADVERRGSKAAVGAGAFNLFRRKTLEAIGGVRSQALSIDEDVRLGQAVKFAGYQTRLWDGLGMVRVRWQEGVWGLVTGMEKNYFAALDFRLLPTLAVLFAIALVGVAPPLAIVIGPNELRLLGLIALACQAATLAVVGKGGGLLWYQLATIPLGCGLMVLSLGRSAWFTLRRGGVSWRGHLYALAELKAHVRRRNRWLSELWHSTR